MCAIAVADKELVCRGVRILADPQVITPPIAAAIRSGTYEGAEAAQLAAIVRPGDVVLEIGAGIGFISTLLARLPGVAQVIAVEANPDLIPYMTRLHALNGVGKVQRLNVVLTNGPEREATFYQRRDFWMGSLAPGPNPWVSCAQVPTCNLNRLLADSAASLIICDIEGAEANLFADADLSRVERVCVELHDHVTGLSGVRDLFCSMAQAGLAYDPRYSSGAVVLFRRVADPDIPRPYDGPF